MLLQTNTGRTTNIFPSYRCISLSITTFLLLSLTTVAQSTSIETLLSEADDRIEKHRKGTVKIQITLEDGTVLPENTKLTAKLIRHDFLFGSNLFGFNNARGNDESSYRGRFAEIFNYATLPFYWETYEPETGKPEIKRWMDAADWSAENGIKTKGHPLIWKMEPQWIVQYPDSEKKKLALNRVTDIVQSFSDQISVWDVVNEPSWGKKDSNRENAQALSLLYEHGETALIHTAHALARKANPDAYLIINDHDTTTRFEEIIRNALNANTDFDAIGIQSHMHEGYWDAQRTWNTIERFAKYGKPIHFTEVAILSGPIRKPSKLKKKIGRINSILNAAFVENWVSDDEPWESTEAGELRQATQVREFYKILFSHPSVEAITWWDFSDRYAWKDAPSGLLDKNLNPKPAFYALHKLVNDSWTTDLKLESDTEGNTIRGFYGIYKVSAQVNGKKVEGNFHLKRQNDQTVQVILK